MNQEIDEDVIMLDIDNFVPIDEWDYEEPPSSDHEHKNNSFRLGLELETGKLFTNQILNYHRFHKEPLFTCTKDGKKLFHVEIDGADIEYVTVPFSNDEESDLRDCITIIQQSSAILKENINSNAVNYTFKKWYDQLKELGLNLHEEPLFHRVENEVISWKKGRMKWPGFFQPHSTIQIQLETVIDLLFEIFEYTPGIEMIFEASLPFETKEDFIHYMKSDKLTRKTLRKKFDTKIDGLMFLLAQTLLNLTIPVYGENKSSIEINKNLMNDHMRFHQTCPKIFLHAMSRRPFSDMLDQIGPQKVGFSKLFKSRMKNNLLFSNLDAFFKYYNTQIFDEGIENNSNGVPEHFQYANYADSYRVGELEEPADLRDILKIDYFKKDEISEETLNNLLKDGVISSGMLRAMKEEALKKFNFDKVIQFLNYDSVVDSVENPFFKPIISFKDNKFCIEQSNEIVNEKIPHDFLSPLPASSPSGVGIDKRNCDSMGSYQKTAEEIEADKYGEAIIEIRAIGYAYHKDLGNRLLHDGEMIPNLFLSEIEYFTSDFLSLFKLIRSLK